MQDPKVWDTKIFLHDNNKYSKRLIFFFRNIIPECVNVIKHSAEEMSMQIIEDHVVMVNVSRNITYEIKYYGAVDYVRIIPSNEEYFRVHYYDIRLFFQNS